MKSSIVSLTGQNHVCLVRKLDMLDETGDLSFNFDLANPAR